ncbi:Aminoacyl-tRNA synthetase [Baffinella frigidus]|nr:Aminoacyl-tRNA synthetase [Cryptophyta sp. CCMP2293]
MTGSRGIEQARAEGRERWVFYDGPPFATGLPHYGHILAGTIKDVVTRFWAQNGKLVERRWGWDCHGLPIEYEIEQALGVKGRADVEAMGIPAFNAECRAVVMRYAGEWKRVVRRLARWVDMEDDYRTMDAKYMESVWWVFKTLFDKGFVYKGFKVMPYSTACTTALSNFEANLNYKDVSDPAVIVAFPLIDDPGLSVTHPPSELPPTLPPTPPKPTSNNAPKIDISVLTPYLILAARLSQLYPKDASKHYEFLGNHTAASLANRRYSPIFPFLAPSFHPGAEGEGGAFRIVLDDYVGADAGTGFVHMAPGFGEDDYRVCVAQKVVGKEDPRTCPVDKEGRFTEVIGEGLAGRRVKECDKDIIKLEAGRLVQSKTVMHSYPFCWRSETPLIYRTVPSWFVDVERIKDRLLANNAQTEWIPAFVKEKRFHNWLAGARDWAVSRDRFWGTPLPIWSSEDGEEVVCIGSVEELFLKSGVNVTDLHRESIDHIEIPSNRKAPPCYGGFQMCFDCWVERGGWEGAAYLSNRPYLRKREFEKSFPGDFIAEGLDQTRGWFYTLMVLSTALFDKPAFKNVIVNGLVLASDGKKMSKRLKNYPDPELVINKHGADALRVYLISSPVVRAEPLKFAEEGVREVVRDLLLPWYNAYRSRPSSKP